MKRDEASFVEFAEAARDRLRRTAYLLCGDWHQASDFVQEGLIRVYVAWPRLTRNGGELAYARRAVTSAFLDHARRRSSKELVQLPEEHRQGDRAPDIADRLTSRAALLRALVDLPPRQRACVVLRYFDDLGVRETAAALNCSEGTVKSQTARALASLRAGFERAELGELLTEGASSW